MEIGGFSYTVTNMVSPTEELYVQLDLDPPDPNKKKILLIQAWATIRYHEGSEGWTDDSGRDRFYNKEAVVPMVRREKTLVPVFTTEARRYFDGMYKITKVFGAKD